MLTHSIGQADFILMDFIGKSILVEDRKLVHRLFPISAGHRLDKEIVKIFLEEVLRKKWSRNKRTSPI